MNNTDFIHKKPEQHEEDTLRDEYNFSQLKVVARGPGRKQKERLVKLDPDVEEAFPTEESVNEALRLLIKLAQSQVPAK